MSAQVDDRVDGAGGARAGRVAGAVVCAGIAAGTVAWLAWGAWELSREYGGSGMAALAAVTGAMGGVVVGLLTAVAVALLGVRRRRALLVVAASAVPLVAVLAAGSAGALANSRGLAAADAACTSGVQQEVLRLGGEAGRVVPGEVVRGHEPGDQALPQNRSGTFGDLQGRCLAQVAVPRGSGDPAAAVGAAAQRHGWTEAGDGAWRSPSGVVVTVAPDDLPPEESGAEDLVLLAGQGQR